jgi:hypothetical protein
MSYAQVFEHGTVNEQPALDFDDVASPIAGETKARVELVAHDWNADDDWQLFEATCRAVAIRVYHDETRGWETCDYVDPNRVRMRLTNDNGLTIEPRRYSAFWQRAAGKHGFLVADGWIENTDTKGGNAGKPLRRYRLKDAKDNA